MNESIIAAMITGGLSLAGVMISNLLSSRKTEEAIRISQAVMGARVDELTREVREHNGFAHRMPVVEEQIKAINHRINNLEKEKK